MKITFTIQFFLILLFISHNSYNQERIVIEGSVVDEYDIEVPYAAVGIIKKKYWCYIN